MNAYLFNIALWLAVGVAFATLVSVARRGNADQRALRRALAVLPAVVLLVTGYATLHDRNSWVTVEGADWHVALRSGLDHRESLTLIANGSPSRAAQDLIDRSDTVRTIHDLSLPQGAGLRIDMVDTNRAAVESPDLEAPLFIAGRRIVTTDTVSLTERTSVVRWGNTQLDLNLRPIGSQFSHSLLLLAAVMLLAGLCVTRHPGGAVWTLFLAVLATGVVVQARLGTDQAILTSYRAMLAAAATMATAAIALDRSSRRQRLLLEFGQFFAIAAVVSASGPAYIGRPGLLEVTTLILPILAAGLPGYSMRVRDFIARFRFRSMDRPTSRWIILISASLAIVCAALHLPGRFVLIVAMLWSWSSLNARTDLEPERTHRFRATALDVLVAAIGVLSIVPFDFGLGGITAVAFLAPPLITRQRWLFNWYTAGGLLLASTAVVLFAWFHGIPFNVQSRILAYVNPEFGAGSSQLQQARLAVQTGARWGTGWGPPTAIRLPEWDDDFVLASTAFDFGFLGVASLFALFGLAASSLFAAVSKLAFRDDREHARTTFVFGTTFTGLVLLLAAANLGGEMALFPLTGVPIPLLSRSADAALAVLIALVLITHSSPRPTNTKFMWSWMDIRLAGLFGMCLLLSILAIGLWRTQRLATAWLDEPHAKWYAFHEYPRDGELAQIHRRVSKSGQPVFILRKDGGSPSAIAVNGQPIPADKSFSLTGGDEVRIHSMRLRLEPSKWDPKLRLVGWEFGTTDAVIQIGRVRYFDRQFLFRASPLINLWWDSLADLRSVQIKWHDDAWWLNPSSQPYAGAWIVSDSTSGPDGVKPLATSVRVPSGSTPLHVQTGRTRISLLTLPGHRLRIDLDAPQPSFELSKSGTTFLGGARMVQSAQFHNNLVHNRRAQAALRELLETGVVYADAHGDLQRNRDPRGRLEQSAYDEVENFRTRYPAGEHAFIRASDLAYLPDGRPAGLRASLLRQTLTQGHAPQVELALLDRRGRDLSAEQLGLIALIGTGPDGAQPGLRAVADGLAERSDPKKRLALSYPFRAAHGQDNLPIQIRTHLDLDAQQIAVAALQQLGSEWKDRIAELGIENSPIRRLHAVVLAVDQRNEILALASLPTVNNFGAFDDLLNRGTYDPRLEVLAFGPVPAGSVMKLACWPYFVNDAKRYFWIRGDRLFFKTWSETASGHLVAQDFFDRGVVTKAEGVRIPPIHNAHGIGYGYVPLSTHVAKSTNTSLVAPLAHLGRDGLQELVESGRELGMFRPISLIPAEFANPSGQWERWLHWSGQNEALQPMEPAPFGNVKGGRTGAESLATRVHFHLGDLSRVNALNLLTTLNSIVNNGRYVQPSLLAGIGDQTFAPTRPEAVLKPTVARKIRSALRGVVRPGGTAGREFEDNPLLAEKYSLVAKTGTPEHKRIIRLADGHSRLVSDRADKVFVASFKPRPEMSSARISILVYVKGAGPGGVGQKAIDPYAAERTGRRVLEALAGIPSVTRVQSEAARLW